MSRPRHPNGHIEQAIRYAEQLGWRAEKAGPRAHVWGRLYCPFSTREGCIVGIYSTPRVPENHARQIIHKVDACPHRDRTEEGDP